jgi:hypothetical protein
MVQTLKLSNFEWTKNVSLSRPIKKSHTRYDARCTIPRVDIGYFPWTLVVFVAVVVVATKQHKTGS